MVLTREQAKELLEAFWVKFNNQPAVPKVRVTAEESFTYNDFTKINIGGLKKDGSDGVNEVSYLLLEVLDEMRTLQPNTAVQVSVKNPERFIVEALNVVVPGFGEPPFFNFDGVIVKTLRQGKSLEDARTAGVSGCVETGAFGKESYILTGYFNLPKILEITLNDGVDPGTGKKLGLSTGDPRSFKSFDELWDAFMKQVKHFMDIKMKGNDIIESIFAKHFPVPFMSLWICDCVEKAKDYNCGGTRYNTQYLQVVGLGTMAYSLTSLKYHVFDQKAVSMDELLDALRYNFSGQYEILRQTILNKTLNTAKTITRPRQNWLTNRQYDRSYPPSPIRRASKKPTFCPAAHVYFKVTGATPGGRKPGFPVSEGISPVQGSDRKASLQSLGQFQNVTGTKPAGPCKPKVKSQVCWG